MKYARNDVHILSSDNASFISSKTYRIVRYKMNFNSDTFDILKDGKRKRCFRPRTIFFDSSNTWLCRISHVTGIYWLLERSSARAVRGPRDDIHRYVSFDVTTTTINISPKPFKIRAYLRVLRKIPLYRCLFVSEIVRGTRKKWEIYRVEKLKRNTNKGIFH